MAWKTLSSKEIYRNRWLWLTEDEVETDLGVRAQYAILHKKPFALIIPWDGQHFTLVGQYRYHVNFDSWEFPQGHYEHDSLSETAQQELKEETGLTANEIELIHRFYANPGAIDQECYVFLATGLSQGQQNLEPSEQGLKTRRVTIDEMEQLIKQGEIKDGATIAALNLFLLDRRLNYE